MERRSLKMQDKKTIAQMKFARNVLCAAAELTGAASDSWLSVNPVQWDKVTEDTLEALDAFNRIVERSKRELYDAQEGE